MILRMLDRSAAVLLCLTILAVLAVAIFEVHSFDEFWQC